MPKRLVGTTLLAALLWFLPAPPAGAAIPPGRYAIGDSVMLGARDDLTARGFRVNAHVSRQFRDAVGIVRDLKAAGKLRRKIVIHLGNNGILIEGSDCDRISNIAGSQRIVYLVNLKIPRSYRATQNRRLAACAARHANTRLLDWFHLSKDHPSWFASDGYHLSATGRARYASFLDGKTS